MLIKDTGLISTPASVEVFEYTGDSISLLRDLGYKIIMVSNQTVVSRGILTFEEMIKLNDYILEQIKKQNPKAHFDSLYFSPFHPNASVLEYRKDSDCRKPRPGMFLKARCEHHIDFSQSIVIGDRLSDIYAGKSVGCQGFQLLTGSENEPLIESTLELNSEWLQPDHKFANLYEAVLFIDKNQGRHQ